MFCYTIVSDHISLDSRLLSLVVTQGEGNLVLFSAFALGYLHHSKQHVSVDRVLVSLIQQHHSVAQR